MTDERKYKEEEVKEIFDLATDRSEGARPAVSDDAGLTLAELQEVGLEVGVEPARIAEAAFAVDTRREVVPRRTFLGVPISVGRTVDLPRVLTDREWQILVGELRETFAARGQVTSHGDIREWTNGNLHVFLEPTATGDRLRLRTHKGTAMPLFTLGAASLGLGLVLTALFFFEELGRAEIVVPMLLAMFGGGTLVSNVLRLPRWARERERQMEYIAGRVGALLGHPVQSGSLTEQLSEPSAEIE